MALFSAIGIKNIFQIWMKMESYAPYLNWIENQEEFILKTLKEWISINTFSTNIQGLAQLLPILQSAFEMLGGEEQYYSLSPQKVYIEGKVKLQPLGQALHIQKRKNATIRILLGGHYDTVHSPTSHFQHIEEKEKGIWKGPGVADMKGGIMILLMALAALERSPYANRIGWEVLLTPDEEIGSPGSAALYASAADRNQLGIIFEPSFPDGAFVSERKGSITYSIIVRGRPAHVGRDFDHGRSAVFALAHMINKLETLRIDNEMTINVADIEGKGPVNIVPALACCHVNIRSFHIENIKKVTEELHRLGKNCEREGIQIEIVQDSFRTPKRFDLPTQHLFEAYQGCAKDLKIPFQFRSSGGLSDGNILGEKGLPTLDTAGAIGGALHTPDEYLILSSLVERAKLTALFLFKLATGEIQLSKQEVRHE